MKVMLILLALCAATAAGAETCLQTDKQGKAGDSRYYDYGRCKQDGGNKYGAIQSIGQQMLNNSANGDGDDRGGYSDAEREAYRRSEAQWKKDQQERRAAVKYGASAELGGLDYSVYLYTNPGVTDAQRAAVRQEIGDTIASGQLLEKYGQLDWANASSTQTWKTADPAQRFRACEVATQLAGAYLFGNNVKPSDKNPAKGFAIAKAGYVENCGGTAYWLGRLYEEGDALVPGVDEADLGKYPKSSIRSAYDHAIINGYTPAFERMAELYRVGGPPRYRDKTYWEFPSDFYPYWSFRPNDNDDMFIQRFQYSECLRADPANLVCARGLVTLHNDESRDSSDGYTNYDPKLAAYYAHYVKNLEALLAKSQLN